MLQESVPKTLILFCDDPLNSYYDDWRNSLVNSELFDVDECNLYEIRQIQRLKQRIGDYDLIIGLHSILANAKNVKFMMAYVPVLMKRRGVFATFVGNEYNFPFRGIRLQERIDLLRILKPEFLLTQILAESASQVFSRLESTQVVSVPHALNPEIFYSRIPQKDRPVELGIRTGKYPAFLGDQDRNLVVEYFRDHGDELGIKTDIDNHFQNKLPPPEWAALLGQCQGTIGTEAGTYYLEDDDHTVLEIQDYIHQKEGIGNDQWLHRWFLKYYSRYHGGMNYGLLLTLENRLQRMGWLRNDSARVNLLINYDFEEIWERFFKDYKNPINGKCISSRHFDAIGTKTCNILFEGRYNDILIQDEHYLCVKKDFSNVAAVMEKFKDLSFRNQLVERTHEYIMDAHTFDHRMKQIASLVS